MATTELCDILQIPRGVTAVIGSGGKTTLIEALAEELSARGRVIVTTTTHIFRPTRFAFFEVLTQVDSVAAVGSLAPNGKLAAPQQSFEELAELAEFVLVEADGSRRLPLKAHAPHEPVLPSNTAATITVVGASGLGRPIEDVVHRPELFRALTGESDLATPQAVAAVLKAEGLTNRVLINQADSPDRIRAAYQLRELLDCPTVIAALQRREILCL